MGMIVDMDQHLCERPTMWREYCDPNKRHLAVTIEPDELGYWWVTVPPAGQRLYFRGVSQPGDGFASYGALYDRWVKGLPSDVNYAEDLPDDYWNPAARAARLEEWGIDKALIIPEVELVFARGVPKSRVDIMRANMEAWNRWAVEIRQEGRGRLEPLGHVTLRGGDLTWLDQQLDYLSSHGIKAATFSYGLIDGRRMSHPDHDRAWASFVEHGIVPVFHVEDADLRASGLANEWWEHDDDPRFSLLDITFSNVGIQVTIADMIFNGVFDRFPQLKIGCAELSATWVPYLLGAGKTPAVDGAASSVGTGATSTLGSGTLLSPNGADLDSAYNFRLAAHGSAMWDLKMPPSEYIRRHIRTAATCAEPIGQYFEWGMGDIVMFGGDYPHSEGLRSPLADYSAGVGDLPEEQLAKLLGGNAAELLGIG
jgi:predicted TIM-barrel fold metal-dependent hydrolase